GHIALPIAPRDKSRRLGALGHRAVCHGAFSGSADLPRRRLRHVPLVPRDEEESFESPEIAQVLNERFVPVKVDREERPDVDAIYMQAVQMLTQHGGWPMSVFLTPEGKPFFGGTYFPARDGDRGARYGFGTILLELDRVYREERERAVKSAEQIAQAVQQALSADAP